MRDGIKQATAAERDRIVALIEHATEAWVEETPALRAGPLTLPP